MRFVIKSGSPAYCKTLEVDPVAVVIRHQFLKADISSDRIVAAVSYHLDKLIFLCDLPVAVLLNAVMELEKSDDVTIDSGIPYGLSDNLIVAYESPALYSFRDIVYINRTFDLEIFPEILTGIDSGRGCGDEFFAPLIFLMSSRVRSS